MYGTIMLILFTLSTIMI